MISEATGRKTCTGLREKQLAKTLAKCKNNALAHSIQSCRASQHQLFINPPIAARLDTGILCRAAIAQAATAPSLTWSWMLPMSITMSANVTSCHFPAAKSKRHSWVRRRKGFYTHVELKTKAISKDTLFRWMWADLHKKREATGVFLVNVKKDGDNQCQRLFLGSGCKHTHIQPR